MILPPTSEISHHHKVTNITMSPTSLSPSDVTNIAVAVGYNDYYWNWYLKNKVDLTVTRYLKIVLILPPILTVSISYLVFTFARVALLSASREWQKKHKYVHFFTQTSSQVVTKLSYRILAENPLILIIWLITCHPDNVCRSVLVKEH